LSKEPDYYFVHSPEDVKVATKKLGVDFLLDFSHAAITAKGFGKDYKKFILELSSLNPAMFHICDNKFDSPFDMHLPLGRGDYDIKFFASLVGDNDMTLEVSSGHMDGRLPTLSDFTESIDHLRSLGVRVGK
jgi:sugar phosphate isomerase/epimerase